MLTTKQLPAVFEAMANTGRILIVTGDPTTSPRLAVREACKLITGSEVVRASVNEVYENPAMLQNDCVIVLRDATDALDGDAESESRFRSLAWRRGYKATVIAPVELASYDSHVAENCINVKVVA